MEAYELDKKTIVEWAADYASYEELETVAKAVYNVFKARQHDEHPEHFRKAKAYKNKKRIESPIKPKKKLKEYNRSKNGPVKVIRVSRTIPLL